MKKIFSLLTLPLMGLALLVSSCSGEEEDANKVLSTDLLKVYDQTLLGSTADTTFTVEANSAWTVGLCDASGNSVADSDNFLLTSSTAKQNGNGTIQIRPGVNPSAISNRTWYLKVVSDAGVQCVITVTQQPSSGNISLSQSTLEIPSLAGQQTITVTSNGAWTVSGKPDWITLSPESGSGSTDVVVSYSENTTTAARTCTLVFTETKSNSKATLNITQAKRGMVLLLNESELMVPNTEGSYQIGFYSSRDWRLSVSGSGVTAAKTTGGSGDNTLTISVARNNQLGSRSATLTFTIFDDNNEPMQQTCTVIQAGQGAPTVSTLTVQTNDAKTNASLYGAFQIPTDESVSVIQSVGFYVLALDEELAEVPVSLSGREGVQTVASRTSGLKSGSFSGSTTLQAEKVYYVQAFATNNEGTGLSQIRMVSTKTDQPAVVISVPQVGELRVEAVESTTAMAVCEYTITGQDEQVTEAGFYLSTTEAGDLRSVEGAVYVPAQTIPQSNQGGFLEAGLTELTPQTTYYIQASVTNQAGTTMSRVAQFTTQGGSPNEGDNNTPGVND